jgi:hypothetical protein
MKIGNNDKTKCCMETKGIFNGQFKIVYGLGVISEMKTTAVHVNRVRICL